MNDEHRLIVSSGEIIGKKYRVIEEINTGAYSNVYLCRIVGNSKSKHAEKKNDVIVKCYKAIEEYTECAVREIKVMKMLNKLDPDNEFFVKYYGKFLHRGHMCMAMQRYGYSLYDAFEARNFKPFKLSALRTIMYKVCLSLQILHRSQLIHTDIKLENVLLPIGFDVALLDEEPLSDPSNDECSSKASNNNNKGNDHIDVRLIDFGSLTNANYWHCFLATTRRYRAPEIMMGLRWGIECDIWSLGCLLIEMATGEILFDSKIDNERLFLIQHTIGPYPRWMIKQTPIQNIKDSFHGNLMKLDDDINISKIPTLRTSLKFDPDLEDLALKMLCTDPLARLSIDEIVKHQFFDPCR